MTGAIKMLKCEFKHGECVVPTARSQGARPAVDTPELRLSGGQRRLCGDDDDDDDVCMGILNSYQSNGEQACVWPAGRAECLRRTRPA